MKKLVICLMSVTLLMLTLLAPTTAHAAENNEWVLYRISAPINYSTVNTSDIKNMTVHFGVNGWQEIKDVQLNRSIVDYYMGRTFESFWVDVYLKKGSTLDYCFKYDFNSDKINWDNNSGKDYHVVVDKSNIN
ncbi:carbohydrate-binding protein [Clostridium frigidicarnis]|uniref:Starch/carbohydrate-binding module (Family 53) n=1 Tax=Clostridium frigidicarnis TaxID=84698 RepID=A0A1I0W0W2_9CLOT|nr:carbohydrate-binding protein [Clostridium frigidicarnis]SFA81850.1 Starch/carbohydrate-binding module (family 53) [Clostridium frigidicarnis]